MDRTELERAVRKLAVARAEANKTRGLYGDILDEFQMRPDVIKAQIAKQEADSREDLATKELKLLAQGIFAQEKNKDIHPVVKIKDYNVYEYVEAYAQEWCKANFPIAFVFDNKKLEGYLKICPPADVPFVKFVKEPRATIATDLSEYLESEK